MRRRSFWGGWGGRVITILIGILVVALLVGWVLLWVHLPGGPNISLLILGCFGFTLVLTMLFTLQHRLTTYSRLRQAEAAYLAGVSHNLRTPIGAIRAAAQALEDTNLDFEQRSRFHQAIVHETRSLALRIDNVLETGRIEIERLAFERQAVNLSELIRSIGEFSRDLITIRGGTLRLNIPPDIWILGDQRGLRLLADNLLDNAIKYSRETIDISIGLEYRPGFAFLQIIDQGVGIRNEDLSQVYRRFWRGDTGRSGTGLGLSLAQGIARRHGGDIHIHSDGLGQGSIAEVWLPTEDLP
ncbi:MAG: HAMP domain-containing sensor histidine kinase [Planctomycetota bacterium]|jgi:signal transduction histidine kinase|nr:HAMP domain-containing sensor histidine kinase [Planctomycetota bacterium]